MCSNSSQPPNHTKTSTGTRVEINTEIETSLNRSDEDLCHYIGNILSKLHLLCQNQQHQYREKDNHKMIEGLLIATTLQEELEQRLKKNAHKNKGYITNQ